MTVQYAVTFEFDSRPPVTHRGTVAARGAHTCASRAIKTAQRAVRPVNWTSMVFVVLERAYTRPVMDEAQAEGESPNLGLD
jgi:hypothetical protein